MMLRFTTEAPAFRERALLADLTSRRRAEALRSRVSRKAAPAGISITENRKAALDLAAEKFRPPAA
jgi:hypothetical protein